MDNVIYPDNNFIATSLSHFAPSKLFHDCGKIKFLEWKTVVESSQVRSKKKNSEIFYRKCIL